jgi:putative DNA primase/helicase
MRAKVSNGPDWGGFDYRLERLEVEGYPGVEAQRVTWGDPIEGSARDILARFEEKPSDDLKSAVFLREALKDGPQLAAELIAKAERAGINERTLQRAFKQLGGVRERHGAKREHFIVWELPRPEA